jgi:hypothetical protein
VLLLAARYLFVILKALLRVSRRVSKLLGIGRDEG